MTVREVLSAEYRAMRASIDEVVHEALKVPVRDGFVELLDTARARDVPVRLVSSGFRQLIEPILDREGVLGTVPLAASDIMFGTDGAPSFRWRELPTCTHCGEACKRHDIETMQARAGVHGPVTFVGDGYSDRCGAEAADRIFARDSLAEHLRSHDAPFESWEDFHDVRRALGWE